MQSVSFSKFKKFFGIVALAAVLVISNIFTYTVANNNKSPEPHITQPGYSVEFCEPNKTNMEVRRFAPRISGLEDSELQNKINDNLVAVFAHWWLEKRPWLSDMRTALSTDKYLSVMIVYAFSSRPHSNHDYEYAYVCNTIDMSTGEVLYLDDIIEADEELVAMILTEGTIKMYADSWTAPTDNYPQEYLDTKKPERVLERLQLCSVPHAEYEWGYKPTFYLEKNRIYLLNVLNEYSSFYIETDKISHKLKVDAW